MRKNKLMIAAALVLTLSFAGCVQNPSANGGSNTIVNSDTNAVTNADGEDLQDASNSNNAQMDDNSSNLTAISLSDFDFSVSNRDQDASYDAADATYIIFSDSAVSADRNDVLVSGTTVTISAEGTYVVSGSCSNGQIIVNANDAKVQLVLKGLELSSAAAPLIVEEADKVFLTLEEGFSNYLSDGQEYELTVDDSIVDAAIFSKDDLTINGTGSLQVTGNFKHGIVSKDDLIVTGGVITVESIGCGMVGKDSVRITDGILSIISGTDGIRSNNDEDSDKGFIWISGGNIDIQSAHDGIQAEKVCKMEDGNIHIVTGNGSESVTHTSNKGMQMWNQSQKQDENEETVSLKGIKAGQIFVISGGTINVDSEDDSIHSNDTILISGGELNLMSGDDGVHADSVLTIDDGTIIVGTSYEGLEAGEITINGGTIDILSSDDGLNAAGGNDTTSESGRKQDMFASDSSRHLIINGGYLKVNAGGDGLDSNGDIQIHGGITLVSGPTDNANGAIDSGSGVTIDGGVLIAAGSMGMAEGVSSNTQASISANISGSANTSIAICDENGTVLASFIPAKNYQNVVISTPEMIDGSAYELVIGGTIANADANGFASSSTVEGGTSTSVTASLSGMRSGGMMNNGGMGGHGGGNGNLTGKPNKNFDESMELPEDRFHVPDDMPEQFNKPEEDPDYTIPEIPQNDLQNEEISGEAI
ncbi:MAG: carbohydrate-binding domain-containing protein [Lachnospiraceae bacterium]